MKQNLHFITLATADLDATRAFYGALGWTPLADVDGEIIFYQTAPGLVLGFFDARKFNQDLATTTDHSQVGGITLSHNVDSPADVHSLVDAMATAGGTVLKAPQARTVRRDLPRPRPRPQRRHLGDRTQPRLGHRLRRQRLLRKCIVTARA